MWGDMGSMMGYGGGWGFLGVLHMLLWWVLIILGIVVLVKWLVAQGAIHAERRSCTRDPARALRARGDRQG